jgi:hypothetical protein
MWRSQALGGLMAGVGPLESAAKNYRMSGSFNPL